MNSNEKERSLNACRNKAMENYDQTPKAVLRYILCLERSVKDFYRNEINVNR